MNAQISTSSGQSTRFPNFKKIPRPPDPHNGASEPPPSNSPSSHIHVPQISSASLAVEELERDTSPPCLASDGEDGSVPPRLKVTRRGKVAAPLVTKAHQAKVAARGRFHSMVITSPNMTYVPEWPVESSVVETFSDGRWGVHEYSLVPQDLCRGMWHAACIPSGPVPPELPTILWESLLPQTHWKDDISIGLNGLGFIIEDTRRALMHAALKVIQKWLAMNVPVHVRDYGDFLVMILRQLLSRLQNLPAVPGVAIAVAAHVQRVALELLGLKTYMDIVVPRLESSKDYSTHLLPVVGAFVRDATDAQNCTRVGIPVWFLQPLTRKLAVWAVVECSRPLHLLSEEHSDPPIVQSVKSLVGVSNLTGSWQKSMLLTVSKQVASTHLSSLSLAEVPRLTDDGPPGKRPRVEGHGQSTHLAMRSARGGSLSGSSVVKPHKSRRRGKGRSRAGYGSAEFDSATTKSIPPHVSERPIQPAKQFVPSPFYEVPAVWETALRAASVSRSNMSALYFYPPPFLLDTICTLAPLPIGSNRTHLARTDPKVPRYLHNLARIRPFLRARILDPSLTNQPLTIAGWRVALWGDYTAKSMPMVEGALPSDVRIAHQRKSEVNSVVRLFARVAQLRSYDMFQVVPFEGLELDTITLADDVDGSTRCKFLWEAHEINFRAEVMALDTVLVQTDAWSEVHRWHREALVSSIWGAPASVVSVIPDMEDEEDVRYRWGSSAADRTAAATLHHFAQVMSRWPGCPAAIAEVSSMVFEQDQFSDLQAQVINFYVRTFTKTFSRLPIPPIRMLARSL